MNHKKLPATMTLEYAYIAACLIAILLYICSVGSWSFMNYFDDHYNYILHKDVFTFYGHPIKQLFKMLQHNGINVYEPVGSLLKGGAITVIGFNPMALRLVSFAIHVANFGLLLHWINTITHNMHSHTVRFSYVYICALVFLIHPLNAEVIGWLSAQSYTVALFFSLLACIYFEHMLVADNKKQYNLMTLSIVCYTLSCLAKAPAIVLPAVCSARLIISALASKAVSSASLQYLGWMVLVGAVLFTIVVAANAQGTSNALHANNSFITRAIRAMVVVYLFLCRIVTPYDLRGHYDVIDDGRYSLSEISSHPQTLLAITTLASITLLLLANVKRYPLMAFSWTSYLLWWLPGCGLVDHGWDQLGADRYNYFPLAFLLPGVVEFIDSFYADNIGTKKQKSNVSRINLPTVLRGLGVAAISSALLFLFTRQLGTWRNDKHLLENCVRMDPNDWTCHEYLGNWYGHHEDIESLALKHINKALQLLPSNNVKAELFKIKTYYNFGHQKEACDSAISLHDSVNSVAPVYQPYILNNYVLCKAVKYGVTAPYVEASKPLLHRALQIVHDYESFPEYVVSGLEAHLSALEKWKPGAAYDAALLY